jgi:hypothetical protein
VGMVITVEGMLWMKTLGWQIGGVCDTHVQAGPLERKEVL